MTKKKYKTVVLEEKVYDKLTKDCEKSQSYSDRVNELLDIANNIEELMNQLRYIATPSELREIGQELLDSVDCDEGGWE